MLHPRQLRKSVLLRALGSPVVVAPFLAGMTAAAAVWAAGYEPALGAFAALAGTLSAAAVYVTHLLMRGDRITRQVLDEARTREARQRQQMLDALDAHLATADDDPRPETALRDLRALVKAFDEIERTTTMPAHLPLVVDIRSRVDELFDQCVQSLEHSGRIWQTAAGLNNTPARQPLLEQRERLVAEVQAAVRQLSETLVGLQTLGAGTGSPRELTRLRSELDRSLEDARTIEERVSTFLHTPGGPVPAEPPHVRKTIEE